MESSIIIDASTISESAQTSHSEKQSSPTKISGGRTVGRTACIKCRALHLKCDAQNPCGRCRYYGHECLYAKSRRGMRRPLMGNKALTSTTSNNPLNSVNVNNSDEDIIEDSTDELFTKSSNSSIGSLTRSPSTPTSSERLIHLFYTRFYPADPFALPRDYLLTRLQSDRQSVSYLLNAILYIGSIFDPTTSPQPFRNAALAQVDLLLPTGFNVQALLLVAVALQSETDPPFFVQEALAKAALEKARLLEHLVGMAYALTEPDLVLAASWEKTYRRLYQTDECLWSVEQVPSLYEKSVSDLDRS